MKLHPGSLAVVLCAILALPAPLLRAAHPRRTPVVEVVERVKHAVVNIHSERTVRSSTDELFGQAPSQNRVNGMGTGIVIDPRGYILTNHHVIEDVSLLRIRLGDGTTASARVVARDSGHDLALLKIDVSRPLPVIPLGTASDLMVGETVVAIGNAYGYEHSVTVGVVSAIKRDVTLNKEMSYKALIQTDASINPGNSGGPLLNINGELVGVNVAIRAGAQGIGFAIPVDTALEVAADMLARQRRQGLWHGLVCRDRVVPDNALNGGQNETEIEAASPRPVVAGPRRSLVVERVEAGSPAAQAGLRQGDVVTRIGDLSVTCSLELERALLEATAGDKLPVVVRRGGAEQQLDLVMQGPARTVPAGAELVWRKLGLQLKAADPKLVNHTDPPLEGGLVIADVRSDSAADQAGIQRGDILIGLHEWKTLSLENVLYVLNHPDLARFTPLHFYILRSGTVYHGWFQQVD